jgi:hypothetical protein
MVIFVTLLFLLRYKGIIYSLNQKTQHGKIKF